MTKATAIARTKQLRLAVAGAFFGLALLGAGFTVAELRAFVDLRGSLPAVRLLGRTQPLATGFGPQVTAQAISTCLAGVEALASPFYTEAARREGARICQLTAQETLNAAPTNARARQLLAESLFLLGQRQAAAAALHQAALLAPNTMWLAQRRLMLLSRFDPALQAQTLPDTGPLIAQLIAVPESRDWLAKTYANTPALRPLVEAGASALPAAEAQKFLALVKVRRMAPLGNGS